MVFYQIIWQSVPSIAYPERQSGVRSPVAVEFAGVGVQCQNARDEEEQRAQQAVQQILHLCKRYVSQSSHKLVYGQKGNSL